MIIRRMENEFLRSFCFEEINLSTLKYSESLTSDLTKKEVDIRIITFINQNILKIKRIKNLLFKVPFYINT